MLLGTTLSASLLGNILASKGVIAERQAREISQEQVLEIQKRPRSCKSRS